MISYVTAYPEPPRRDQISYQLNRPAFFKLVEVALAGNGSDSKRALLKFVQTGYDPNLHFYAQAQAIAMLVILLREHRLDQALGAELRATIGDTPLVRSAGKENIIAETIETFGINRGHIIAAPVV